MPGGGDLSAQMWCLIPMKAEMSATQNTAERARPQRMPLAGVRSSWEWRPSSGTFSRQRRGDPGPRAATGSQRLREPRLGASVGPLAAPPPPARLLSPAARARAGPAAAAAFMRRPATVIHLVKIPPADGLYNRACACQIIPLQCAPRVGMGWSAKDLGHRGRPEGSDRRDRWKLAELISRHHPRNPAIGPSTACVRLALPARECRWGV
jgi:hypothetical protein